MQRKWQGPSVDLVHGPVRCGSDLIVFRPTVPIEPKFTGYHWIVLLPKRIKSMMGRGITIAHLQRSTEVFVACPSLPSPDEQAAIVRYLDRADELINRYISAKERLIALLEEERQAIINQAVTRGLDPNAPLKPSGVEWLGEVPAYWKTPVQGSRNNSRQLWHHRRTGQWAARHSSVFVPKSSERDKRTTRPVARDQNPRLTHRDQRGQPSRRRCS